MWKKIIGVLFIGVGIVGIGEYIRTKDIINIMPIILCFSVAFYLISGSKFKRKADRTNSEKYIKRQDKLEQKMQKAEEARNTLSDITHQSGLPLAENALCTVKYEDDMFVITGAGTTFNLATEKITDVSVMTDIEIQKAYVSSIGGAVAGYAFFGGLGAIVGGRAKEKKSKTITRYFIITYKKDEALEYISFDVTKIAMKAYDLANRFNAQETKEIHTVEL